MKLPSTFCLDTSLDTRSRIFRVLEDLSKNPNSTLHIVEAFDHEVDTIADNLQYYIGDKYKVENLHNGSIRVSKIKIKGE